MTFTPRDYQEASVQSALGLWRQYQSLLGLMATGMGKTACAGFIANYFKERGRILWLTHEDQLLKQSQRTLETITGLSSQVEKADQWADARMFGPGLLFATVQTLIAGRNGGRMTRFNPRQFSLAVVDEGHHSVAPSWTKVIKYFQQNEDLKLLLLTATPDRGDEAALGQIAQETAFEYGIDYGLANGWLVPVKQLPAYVHGLDLSEVRTTAGELNGADLARVLEQDKVLYGMATPVLDHCGDEKTLIFTQRVEQARRFAEILNAAKPRSAEYVCGDTPDEYRSNLYARYAAGDFQYLINVGITVEGFDEPGVRWVIMGRPHRSRAAYAQKVGRGTRPLKGVVDGLDSPEDRIRAILNSPKPEMIVMDFCGNAGKHPLVHVGDVLGGKYPDEVVELAERNMERAGKPADVATELQKAEREIARRQAEAQAAAARAHIKVRSIYEFGKSIDPFVALDIVPRREPPWHKGRLATERQRAALENFGVNAPDNLSFVHASQALDALIKRAKEGKPSLKMARLLKKFGFDPDSMTFRQASRAIDDLKANGWKRLQQAVTV